MCLLVSRITNKELAEDLAYIKGKIAAGDRFSKEHRSWEVSALQKIDKHLESQNGRLRSTETAISWFKGLMITITATTGWILKKIVGE